MIILRALGALLTYPRPELLEALDEIGATIDACDRLDRAEKERLAELVAELRRGDALDLEERYVALFERSRARSLHLFEHRHGDSRERGQAMVELLQLYERAGFRLAANELPDYLPALLEYLSCRPVAEARELLGDCAHILRAIGEALAARGSRYAAVFQALLAVACEPGLDWSRPATPDPHPDGEWMDAPAFGPGSERHGGTVAAVPVQLVSRRRG